VGVSPFCRWHRPRRSQSEQECLNRCVIVIYQLEQHVSFEHTQLNLVRQRQVHCVREHVTAEPEFVVSEGRSSFSVRTRGTVTTAVPPFTATEIRSFPSSSPLKASRTASVGERICDIILHTLLLKIVSPGQNGSLRTIARSRSKLGPSAAFATVQRRDASLKPYSTSVTHICVAWGSNCRSRGEGPRRSLVQLEGRHRRDQGA
jgi:hypothetical protein